MLYELLSVHEARSLHLHASCTSYTSSPTREEKVLSSFPADTQIDRDDASQMSTSKRRRHRLLSFKNSKNLEIFRELLEYARPGAVISSKE